MSEKIRKAENQEPGPPAHDDKRAARASTSSAAREEDNAWKVGEFKGIRFLYRLSKQTKSKSVAIYDLKGTLIRPLQDSGEGPGWELASHEVVVKLKEESRKNYRLVAFCNENLSDPDGEAAKTIKKQCESVLKEIKVEMDVFIALTLGVDSSTTKALMWRYFQEHHNGGAPGDDKEFSFVVKKDPSFVVGVQAGKYIDQLFAKAIKVPFRHSKYYFPPKSVEGSTTPDNSRLIGALEARSNATRHIYRQYMDCYEALKVAAEYEEKITLDSKDVMLKKMSEAAWKWIETILEELPDEMQT